MKYCKACDSTRMLAEFSNDSSRKDGKDPQCKVCKKEYYEKNKERHLERARKSHEKNRDNLLEYKKEYYQTNRDKLLEIQKEYKKNNRAMYNAASAKRRAAQLNATPAWLTEEDLMHIQWKYNTAKHMAGLTGNVYHVDHIIPLQGTTVCGLHVPDNLRVVLAEVNLRKSNSFDASIEYTEQP